VKKAFSIFVLALFFFNGIGFYSYYAIELFRIKMSMREAIRKMPPEALQMIRLEPNEFKEARVEDHEISYKGKMYDIAYTRFTNGVVDVYCLEDEAEGDLIRFISEVVSKPIDQRSVPAATIIFITLVFVLPDRIIILPSGQLVELEYFRGTLTVIETFSSPPNRPPIVC
jgi:hypothetical protein